MNDFKPPRSEERVQGTKFLAGVWGLESRARCAGFSVAEIGNRKERLRVREAGASAAGRGQRPYASFPGFLPLNPLRTPSPPIETSRDTLHPGTGATTRTNRPAGRVRGLGLRAQILCSVALIRRSSPLPPKAWLRRGRKTYVA